MHLIHPEVIQRRDDLAEAFKSAAFFPHVEINDFFTPEVCQQLSDQFPEYRPENAVNELGEVGLKASRRDVSQLGEAYARLDAYVQTPEFLGLMSDITGIPDLLYDPDYFGGGTHENLHGTELDIHVDFNYHPKTRWHRRLNLIVFLNEEWDASWGGCFEVHKDPWDRDSNETEAFVPVFNNAVIFETNEVSWHGFNKIQLPEDRQDTSRRSLALYFYTKDRPVRETASAHATVYVPRPLPAHLKPGHTLSVGDLRELKTLLEKRDQQIRFLYDREKELAQVIESGTQELSTGHGERFVAGHTLSAEDASDLADMIRRRDHQINFFKEREKELDEVLEGLMQRLREAEGRVELLSHTQVGGPIEQTQPMQGLWDDQWIGETLTVSFRALQPLERFKLEVWSPDVFPSPRQLTLEIGSMVLQEEIQNGLVELSLPIDIAAGDDELLLKLSLSATYSFLEAGTSTDDRHLGANLRYIGFE